MTTPRSDDLRRDANVVRTVFERTLLTPHSYSAGPARARSAPPEPRLHDGDLPMIVTSHVGENLIPALLAGGAAAGPALLVVMRVRLRRLGRRLRRDRG